MNINFFNHGNKKLKITKEFTKVKTSSASECSSIMNIEEEALIFTSDLPTKISSLSDLVGEEIEVEHKDKKFIIKPEEGVFYNGKFYKWRSNFTFKKFLVKKGNAYFDKLPWKNLVENPKKKKKESNEKPEKKVKFEKEEEKPILVENISEEFIKKN